MEIVTTYRGRDITDGDVEIIRQIEKNLSISRLTGAPYKALFEICILSISSKYVEPGGRNSSTA
jgi:hypothetical protein